MQTGILYRHDIFEFGLNYGLASLKYTDIQGDIINYDESQNEYLNKRSDHILSNFSTTMRLGFKPFKLQMQVGKTANLSHQDFKMNDSYMSMGLFFNIDELFNKE